MHTRLRSSCVQTVAVAAAALTVAVGATPASAASIVALTTDGKLVTFDTERRAAGKAVTVEGLNGKLLGIDVRPMDKKLYGVTDQGTIFTIDPATGKTTPMSQLAQKFEHGGKAVVDFNPQADRLRLLGVNGTSFRVNVVTGEVAVDKSLQFEGKDPNAGKKPAVTAGAYTNSMPNARGTELFNLDTTVGVMVLQSPPNDGILQTRGKIGFSKGAAFDIWLDGNRDNIGYVLDQGTLHTISLDNGAAKEVGKVANLPAVADIAVLMQP